MSVTKTTEQFDERTGTGLSTCSNEHQRTWIVECDDSDDDDAVVLDYMADSVAAFQSPHPNDAITGLERWSVTTVSVNIYKAVAHYTSDGLDPQRAYPLARPTLWNVEFQKATVVMQFDEDDEELLNTAGQPYDPPYETELIRTILVATHFYDNVDWATLNTFNGSINDADWTAGPFGVIPKWAAKCQISIERVWEAGGEYFKWVHRFEIKPTLWHPLKITSMGYNELNRINKLVPCADDTGKPFPQPCLLDANGHRIKIIPAVPYRQEYTEFPDENFDNLNL